ncbi:MAG: YIP1 family protein [Alphaproteobacteria bacterium]|nr:YIP1 family protein [Alphaproteobacteria bacterium]
MATNPTGTAPSLVDRAKNIILRPKEEWAVIDTEPATVGSIYRNYVCILAAIPAVAMAIGLLVFGVSLFLITWRPPIGYVVSQAVLTYVMALVQVFVLALIIEALAPSFGGQKDRVKALKVAAYSYTPAWIAGILYLVPALGLLVLIAGIYGFYLLYLGLPLLMKSAPDKTVVYLIAIIVAAIVVGIVLGAITTAAMHAFMPVGPTAAASGFSLR